MFRKVMNTLNPLRNVWWQRAKFAVTSGQDGSKFQQNSVTKEQQLTKVLRQAMPGITYISVEDISGGCGAMFEVNVEAKEFVGLSRVKQHQLVTNSLKTEIAEMHGIRIHTSQPTADN